MKVSAVVLALSAATVAYGQSISDLPGCALNCFLGPLQSDGCKSLTDFKCHCSNPTLLPKVQPCVEQKCPASLVQEVQDKAVALCKQYGVDLTIPGDGSASSTSPASTSTYKTTSAYTTSKAVSTSTSVYASSYSTVTTRTYPTGNGTSPTLSPPPPTGAAGKASFGGAAVAAAGFAALVL